MNHSGVPSASSTSKVSASSTQLPPKKAKNSSPTSVQLTSLTWNIEGIKRNLYSLRKFSDLTQPDLIFISEPQIFQSDLQHSMSLFKGEYSCELNSEDKFDIEASMIRAKAIGGTMVLWKHSIDKYISLYRSPSTSFLPIVFNPPGCPLSVHIALYLPTSGKETEFIEQIVLLSNCLNEFGQQYDDCLIFLRGDGNVNPNNQERTRIFNSFLSNHNLVQSNIQHKTYHHFLGEGIFDSNIDIIAHSEHISISESIISIFCKHEYPEIDSHHDIIISSVSLPSVPKLDFAQPDLVKAPRIELDRNKILWSKEGIKEFQATVADICQRWLNPTSRTSLSILISCTNDILQKVAIATNYSVSLRERKLVKSEKIPKSVKISANRLKQLSKKDALKEAKKKHRSLIRKIKSGKEVVHNEDLFSLVSADPSSAFKLIKSSKASSTVQVPHIMVGNKKYEGDRVVDGLFESISKLKNLDTEQLANSQHHISLMEDYKNIRYLCSNKTDLPAISVERSSEIMGKLKPSVTDLYSITPRHFINAGSAGLVHYNLLLNTLIIDVNNCSIDELNSVYALLLYKGHKKDRTLDTSYRTISTCPLLAKSLDLYVKDLNIEKWNEKQAKTQYQGEGSSHELASLLVTEAIQHSKFISSKPIFLLFLDAMSAFDGVIIPYLVRCLYMAGTVGQSLELIENRLNSRTTYCEFNKVLVRPIHDKRGLEQGGIPSSELYKIYSNELLILAQKSGLGVEMGRGLVLSAVGQADDSVLMSNDLQFLNLLFQLAINYCLKYNVQLSPSKTKLMMILPQNQQIIIPYNPIRINGAEVKFVNEAEHVGVTRSTDGNMTNILQRIAAFKGALGAIISCGLARGHRSNPAVSMRILSTYGTPVLMSGLGSLVLSYKEISVVEKQYKRTLQNLLKLPVNTPACLIYFITGSLPAPAILHLRQITLFSMICRLPGDPLNDYARQVFLTSSVSPKSWFVQIRNLLLQYQLPHPLQLLDFSPSKEAFKILAKSKVIDYWEVKLREEASWLPSLSYFNPQFMSLKSPHKLLSSAGSKSYEVAKALVQLRFLSSQYRCAKLTRFWTPSNTNGLCSFPTCLANNQVESPEHILIFCPAYNTTRLNMVALSLKLANPVSHNLVVINLLSKNTAKIMQLLLDCSSLPDVIVSAQNHGDHIFNDIFYVGRTWCFALHRERLKRLGLWNFR